MRLFPVQQHTRRLLAARRLYAAAYSPLGEKQVVDIFLVVVKSRSNRCNQPGSRSQVQFVRAFQPNISSLRFVQQFGHKIYERRDVACTAAVSCAEFFTTHTKYRTIIALKNH